MSDIVPSRTPRPVQAPPPEPHWVNNAAPGNRYNLGNFVRMLRQLSEQAGAIPTGVSLSALSAQVLHAASRNDKLFACTYVSWAKAITDAYTWGLDPLKREVWFIPYNTTVQTIIGYQGLVTLARRHPDFIDLSADAVSMVDWAAGACRITLEPWSLERDLVLREDDSKGWALSYCQIIFRSNGEVIRRGHVLQWHEVIRRAEASKNCIWDADAKKFKPKGTDSPWVLWPREMARKSVIAALLRSGQIPVTADILAALDREDELLTKMGDDRSVTNSEAAMKLLPEPDLVETPNFKAETERLADKTPVPVAQPSQAPKSAATLTNSIESLRTALDRLSDQGAADIYEAAGLPFGVPVDELNAKQRSALFAALGGG